MHCCRYKKADERQSLDGPMSRLLPRLHHIAVQLFADPSELSVLVQKQILKVFFSLIQVRLANVLLCMLKVKLLLSIPSFSTRIVPLRFQAGGRRRRLNLGLVCLVV